MSFFNIWDEWVAVDNIGNWLNVRQGAAKWWGAGGTLVVEWKKGE
jgi:hypothetical protein